MHPATVAGPIALLAAALALTACGTSAPAHHPAHLTAAQSCRQLRADVLANGTPDARTVLHLLEQDPGNAGRIHGSHGLTMDLDWLYDALTARNRDTAAGKQFAARWEAELAGDCRRAAGVTIPLRGHRRLAPDVLAPAAMVRLTSGRYRG